MILRLLFFALVGNLLSGLAAAATYTYPQLVARMTNLRPLAELPPPGEITALASSYDRGSQYDAKQDKYINWRANNDGMGVVRKEGDQSVLMDVQGPGCIFRMWSARPQQGHVKIYLDGSPTPAVDLPYLSYFDKTVPPFNRPNLVYIPIAKAAKSGFDNFTPIPFQNGCKIVADPGWGDFYHFNYTLFPKGTIVPTFSLKMSAEDSAALDQADKILGQIGQYPDGDAPATKIESKSISAEAGRATTVADLDGPGGITALKVKLTLPTDPEAQRILLHQLTLSITWDGEKTPAVWSPLGDFFSDIGGAAPFQTLPLGLQPDGTFYSYWYMPYATKAHIEVGNDGPTSVPMEWEISHAPLEKPIEQLARFHAKWHRDAFLPTRADRDPDWTVLTTQGRGRFVGLHLHIWNPRAGWWGEGDEKFFVDAEKFPSTYGTGSEDYFGYAWGAPGFFAKAFHSQLLSEHAGHTDDNRWHISDQVPFATSFEADIEKYFTNDRSTFYAATAYWYLNAGGTDPYPPLAVTDRVGWWTTPQIYHEAGAIEGESLPPVTKPTTGFGPQDMFKFGKAWSDDKQLNWGAKPDSPPLELTLPAQKAASYHLMARFTKGPTYGIFQLSLNGVDVGPPIDLYDAIVKAIDPIDLGTVQLTDGKPILKITPVGKNASSTAWTFGLDYLKLTPNP